MYRPNWLVLTLSTLAAINGFTTTCDAQQPDAQAVAQYAWPPLDSQWFEKTKRELSAQVIPPATPAIPLSFSGRVFDAGKRPIEDAVVLVIIDKPITASSDEIKSKIGALAKSDNTGGFAIDEAIDKPSELQMFHLFVIAKGHGFAVHSFTETRIPKAFQVRLLPEQHVDVQATTIEGEPMDSSLLAVEGVTSLARIGRIRMPMSLLQLPFDAHAKSGPDGKLRVGNVPPRGSVSIRVSHHDYPEVRCKVQSSLQSSQPEQVQTISPSYWNAQWLSHQPTATSPVVVQFPPVDRGYIQFLDEQTGDPIVGAEVRSAAWALRPIRTNAQGKCFFLANPTLSLAGTSHSFRITFAPQTSDYPALAMRVNVGADQTVNKRIPRAVELQGIVRDQRSKKTVKDAVVIWVADRNEMFSAKTAARVDPQGQFKITVPEGKGTLLAYHDETETQDFNIAVNAHLLTRANPDPVAINTKAMNVTAPLELFADMPFQRSIMVEDPHGDPAAGVRIRVIGSDVPGSAKSLKTDVNGLALITLKHANPEFTLIATKGDLGARVVSSELRQSGTIRIQLSELATVTGRVLLEGKPIGGLTVELRSQDHSTPSNPFAGKVQRYFVGRTDSRGVYHVQIPTDQAAEFVMFPSSSGATPLQRPTVKVLPATQCFADDIELFTTRGNRDINGIVVDAKGMPVKATIAASRNEPLGEHLYASLQCCTVASDDKGHFKLTSCPDTPLFLLIRHNQLTKVVRIDESQAFVKVQFE